jgi:putative ABC transport system permease protein
MASPRGEGEVMVQTAVRHVTPGYIAALGIRLVAGRDLTDSDTLTAPGVVLVNRSFARAYLSETPLGDRLPSRIGKDQAGAEVVGVVDDVRHRSATDVASPEIYMSYRQLPEGVQHDEAMLAIRTDGDPRRLVDTVQTLVRERDASIAVASVMTMDDRLAESLARPRLYALLLGSFAVFALIIAAVGLFGVLAYSVAQRSREIGVRTALGAKPRDVVALVARQALAMTLGGLVVGVAASFVLVRYLGTFLYGVNARDTATFVAVPCALIVIAIIACAVPARRAARVDPLRALRT